MSRGDASSARIGFDGRYINDRYHGIGRVAFELLRALAAARPDDEFVVYVNPREPNTRFDLGVLAALPNARLRQVHVPLLVPTEQAAWPFVLARDGVQLLHSPYVIAPVVTRVPTIVTVHDLIFERYPEYTPRPWLRAAYRLLAGLSLRRATAVLTVSDATRQDLRQWYRGTARKSITIHNGIDPAFGRVTDPEILARVRSTYGLPAEFVLALGANRPHKNLELIVEAARLEGRQDPTQFVIVSAPDPRWPDRVGSLIEAYGLGDRITRIPHIAEEDLPALYSLARAFVFPSIVEGFGLPLLEAMAAGCPAIAARSSSLPEVGGDAVRYIDPRSPAELVAQIEAVRRSDRSADPLIPRAVERAHTFTWQAAAERVSAVYDTVLADRIRRRPDR